MEARMRIFKLRGVGEFPDPAQWLLDALLRALTGLFRRAS